MKIKKLNWPNRARTASTQTLFISYNVVHFTLRLLDRTVQMSADRYLKESYNKTETMQIINSEDRKSVV